MQYACLIDSQLGKLVVIDEVQRMPEIFAELRSFIDGRRRRGYTHAIFLRLGSAHRMLLQQTSESLAGRVAYVTLGGRDGSVCVDPRTMDGDYRRYGTVVEIIDVKTGKLRHTTTLAGYPISMVDHAGLAVYSESDDGTPSVAIERIRRD